jgi:heparan-alpha-glucosaminide N-acetyltransferase
VRSYIDMKLFGEHHMYHFTAGPLVVGSATCLRSYLCTAPHDPEGTLGAISATIVAFCGVQAGRIVQHHRKRSHGAIVRRWVGWGVILGAIGCALCGGTANGGVLPINKNLWSPSFVAVMSGTGAASRASRG